MALVSDIEYCTPKWINTLLVEQSSWVRVPPSSTCDTIQLSWSFLFGFWKFPYFFKIFFAFLPLARSHAARRLRHCSGSRVRSIASQFTRSVNTAIDGKVYGNNYKTKVRFLADSAHGWNNTQHRLAVHQ